MRLISPVAVEVRSARLRTSSATTANPRPLSPARAASIAALSANKLVWAAISPITRMMLPISWVRWPSMLTAWDAVSTDAAMRSISVEALLTATAPLTASPRAVSASTALDSMLVLIWDMPVPMCSIRLRVCSAAVVCCSERCTTACASASRFLVASSTSCEVKITLPMMSRKLDCRVSKLSPMLCSSALVLIGERRERSPSRAVSAIT